MIQIEKQIANEIAKANGLSLSKLGLRFDKVVVRILGNIRNAVEQEVPKESVIIITISAPIKLPAKTEHELIEKIRNIVSTGKKERDTSLAIFGNEVRIRLLKTSSKKSINFIGLVHNKDIDSKYLLKISSKLN
jgi:hypothetical protein